MSIIIGIQENTRIGINARTGLLLLFIITLQREQSIQNDNYTYVTSQGYILLVREMMAMTLAPGLPNVRPGSGL